MIQKLKLTENQLRKIIRKTLNEIAEVYSGVNVENCIYIENSMNEKYNGFTAKIKTTGTIDEQIFNLIEQYYFEYEILETNEDEYERYDIYVKTKDPGDIDEIVSLIVDGKEQKQNIELYERIVLSDSYKEMMKECFDLLSNKFKENYGKNILDEFYSDLYYKENDY